MKIYFDGVNFSSRTGPNTFAQRLAKQFVVMGHEIADSNHYDIMFVFIEPTRQPSSGAKVVQRLDGIWFKENEFKTKNVGIKACYDSADGVIWQSTFDASMITKWWGTPKYGRVIHNGIDISSMNKPSEIPALTSLQNEYETIFVCSSNWHPQKRLRENIRLFDELHRKFYHNSCLIVLGSNPDVNVPNPHVFYGGSMSHEACLSVYDAAHWMLHLAWLDHCPNVVVEALSRSTPVICTDSGGTQELVGDYGLILKESNEYRFDLIDYDKPPSIDFTQITEPLPVPIKGSHANIDIINCAKQYIEVFEKVL